MRYFSKYLATVKTGNPDDVKNECLGKGWTYDKGAIFVYIPELGFEGTNYVYCRYGLSVPYLRVKDGWKVWVEPTIGEYDRWIYTGIADTSQDSSIDPTTDDMGLIILPEGTYHIKIGDNEIKMSADGVNIVDGVNGNSVELTSTGIKVIDGVNSLEIDMEVAGITLKSGDASTWCPNILAVCPFSGALHGGAGAGIIKLKGA